jgi:hypothetical protein
VELRLLCLLLAVLLLLGIREYVGSRVSRPSSAPQAASIPSTHPGPAEPASPVVATNSGVSPGAQPGRDSTQGRAASWSPAKPVHAGLSTCGIAAVGQPCDIVVRADAPFVIGQLAFTVSADPRMLRLQSVAGGGWNGGHAPTFITEGAPGSGDFIIRLELPSGGGDNRDGSLATLQFEALAAGTVTIGVSDLTITDPSGRLVAADAASLTTEAEVLSGAL